MTTTHEASPLTPADAEDLRRRKAEQILEAMQGLAEEISEAWESPKSALELLNEDRRGPNRGHPNI